MRSSGTPQQPSSDDFITIEVEADGFLYNMVRAIVGTLVEVGRGHRSETWPGEVLRAAEPPRRRPHRPAARAFLGQGGVLRVRRDCKRGHSVDARVEQ